MSDNAHNKPTIADAGLSKFDAPVLKNIGSSELVTSNGNAFLPANMGEAMELGKLMSASNFVPAHLRGKPGDCLAVVMQSSRWGMDPFAVANKTYFVQDRIAYEAQLVNAVLNARAPLNGRLQVSWDGEGATLTCKVVGHIKGDPEPHTVWQELASIKTRNSPLWASSPRQQLAYYTTRLWARLYCPEVLLGVYTEEEVADIGPVHQQADGSQVIEPKPRSDAGAAQVSKLESKIAAEPTKPEEIIDPSKEFSSLSKEITKQDKSTWQAWLDSTLIRRHRLGDVAPDLAAKLQAAVDGKTAAYGGAA